MGGTDPEPADRARRSMPLGTRTLGRAVSLLDYEDFALAFAGIAKARAAVLNLPAGPTIVITVAGQNAAPLSDADAAAMKDPNLFKRVNVERAEELVGTGAAVIGTACPFCQTMFRDALGVVTQTPPQLLDIAQIAAAALPDEKPKPVA